MGKAIHGQEINTLRISIDILLCLNVGISVICFLHLIAAPFQRISIKLCLLSSKFEIYNFAQISFFVRFFSVFSSIYFNFTSFFTLFHHHIQYQNMKFFPVCAGNVQLVFRIWVHMKGRGSETFSHTFSHDHSKRVFSFT